MCNHNFISFVDYITEEVVSSSISEYNEDELISTETVDAKESKTTYTSESVNLNQQTYEIYLLIILLKLIISVCWENRLLQ